MTDEERPRKVWSLGRYHIPEVMDFIGECNSVMSSEIRDFTNARNNFRNAIDVLVNMGLATRDHTPEDMRYTFVSLTDKGIAVLAKLDEIERILEEAGGSE